MNQYKIIANIQQLEDVGIDYDISGLTGTLIKKYPDGYYCLEVTHVLGEGRVFTNEFDIPQQYLLKIN